VIEKSHAFYGTISFITVHTKALHLFESVARLLLNILTPYTCEMNFNIILPSMPRSYKSFVFISTSKIIFQSI
jgi:hypothetical protein